MSAGRVLRDVFALSKPRITALVLTTTAGGLFLAPGAVTALGVVFVLASTALTVAAANTLNCWLERDIDRRMERTRNRPLPAGRLPASFALAMGAVLAVLSIPLLALLVNSLTALLGAIALVSYVLVYTPMKVRSPLALFVGAIPGAIPPLMGYTAVTGRIDLEGVVLFGILFAWQIPHFLAIALFRKNDYAGAGFKVMPVVWGERRTRLHAFVWSLVLAPVAILPWPLAMTGPLYGVVAAALSAIFVALSARGLRRDADDRWARGFFFYTLAYLTLLFAALVVDAR